MPEFLETNQTGRVLTVSMNRPEKRNALHADLCRSLVRTIEEAERDPHVGAILLRAHGSSFCAGMDLSEMPSENTAEIDQLHEQLFTLGARVAKPIVAAVLGPALGGGTGLVANCHLVVAGEKATFGLTEIRLGLWPFLVYRAVSAAVGERRTMELSLTGWIFGPREAKEMGLIHEIADDAEGRAEEVAHNVAAWSPTAIRAGMSFAHEVRGLSWRDSGEIARKVRGEVFQSADLREGIRAFQEKRRPKWPSLE